jgi:hypothetical protein
MLAMKASLRPGSGQEVVERRAQLCSLAEGTWGQRLIGLQWVATSRDDHAERVDDLRGVLVLLGFLLTASAQAQAPKDDRAAEKATVEQTFRDYAAAFWTDDMKKVTTYYNDPMMLMPAGRVVTRAEAEQIMERNRDNARSRGAVEGVLER